MTYQYPFQNPDLPTEERIDNLLSLMTLEEKVSSLSTNPNIPRLGVVATRHAEGLHGLAVGGPGKWGGDHPIPTTTFPQEIGLGETWDPELIGRVAAVEGYEARYIAQSPKYGRSQMLIRTPNADLGRDPRWGRTEECYGEDAHFNGTMTVAFVRGLQGNHPNYWQCAALLKHFLANSNENGREYSSSDFDERLFREYYSVPFRRGIIEGGARAFMAAYNAYNGTPCHVHPMLKEIAVGEWGQDGIICTDGGAMKLLVTDHKYVPDFTQACAAIIKAGIGQFLDDFREPTTEALEQGLLTEVDLDAVLRGTYRVMIKMGLLDPAERVPYSQIGLEDNDPWLTDEHKALARLVTQKSIVLLKNSEDLLPLDKNALTSIAVIGPYADRVLLDWYSGDPPYTVTPLTGIQEALGNTVTINYADGSDYAAAVALARISDVVVLCVGNHPTGDGGWAKVTKPEYGKESVDRESLTLEDEALIQQVYAVNPKTIVTLISSFPYAINWTQEHVSSILHMTHNSQETGHALADVLFGDYNPAGRLVQTWPQSLEQLPPMMDYDIRNGRTYQYFKDTPLYPFGFGLSYTTFAYAHLQTSAEALNADGEITVSVDVTNTGKYSGEEVVQIYVTHLDSSVERPLQALVGFQRVAFEPGETKTIPFPLLASQLAYWNTAEHRFVVEAGQIKIRAGRSSADIELEHTISIR